MKPSVSLWRRDKEDFELTCYNCGQKEHSALVRAEDRNNGNIFVSASLITMLTADKGRGTMQNQQRTTHLHSNLWTETKRASSLYWDSVTHNNRH